MNVKFRALSLKNSIVYGLAFAGAISIGSFLFKQLFITVDGDPVPDGSVTGVISPSPVYIEDASPLTFEGDVKAVWLRNSGIHNHMQLIEDFSFVDKLNYKWIAVRQTTIDGASIPSEAWQFIGSPYVGKYREPSVIHDAYCSSKTAPSQAVHEMFRDAMQAREVEDWRINIMLSAIELNNACQWKTHSEIEFYEHQYNLLPDGSREAAFIRNQLTEQKILNAYEVETKVPPKEEREKIYRWIQENDPSKAEIKAAIFELMAVDKETSEYNRLKNYYDERLLLDSNLSTGRF